MKYKGIIFDMDGVIVDTNQLHYIAWKAVADQIGLTKYTYDDNENERGAGRREGIKRLAQLANKILTEEQMDNLELLKNNIFMENLANCKKEDILFADVEETLKVLKQKGIKLALGSSSKNAKLVIENVGLTKYFDVFCDASMVSKAKPDPQIFLVCLKELNLPSNEVLIVEDTVNGIMAGKQAQIDCCGKLNAKYFKDTKYPIDNLKDVLKIVI